MIVRRLDQNWDMTFGQGLSNYVKDQTAVAQAVRSRLFLLRGEWFLDVDAGIPYLQEIAVKPSNLSLAESYIKQEIIDTDGVQELTSFDMNFDPNTRTLNMAITVTTIYGTTENIEARV
jgi:hypothetical protein